MNVRVHRDKLHADLDTLGYVVDIFMLVLIGANLALIIFDWMFQALWVKQLLQQFTPTFFAFYDQTIHADFVFWDGLFVAVYLTEFMVRWGFAIGRRSYERWYIFPFAHWYDLLGCIPVGSFRWLRILRVVSLLYRLQKRGIIDLRDTWLGALIIRYYRVVVEEISDRVVVNVLEGAQRELRTDTPLVHRIEREVLAPRKQELVDFAVTTLIDVAARSHQRWRTPLGHYLAELTRAALADTRIGARINAIPGAGARLMAALSDQTEEIGLAFADQLIEDLTDPENRPTLDAVLEGILVRAGGDRQVLDSLIRDTLLDLLDQVKAQVAVQQWRLEGEKT